MAKVQTNGSGKIYLNQSNQILLGNDMSDDTVVATGSTEPRTLANRFADVINVKDFGAVGDGVTDDTAAIQAFIDRLKIKGGIGYIPEGIYIVQTITIESENLFDNKAFSIIGSGIDSTIIKQVRSTPYHVLWFKKLKNFSIKNLTIDGGVQQLASAISPYQNDCLDFVDCSDYIVDSVKMIGFLKVGILSYLSGTNVMSSEHCIIKNCIIDGISCFNPNVWNDSSTPEHGAMVLVSMHHCTVENVKAYNCSGWGLEYKGYNNWAGIDASEWGECKDCAFINCYTENCGYGGIAFGGEPFAQTTTTARHHTGVFVNGITIKNCFYSVTLHQVSNGYFNDIQIIYNDDYQFLTQACPIIVKDSNDIYIKTSIIGLKDYYWFVDLIRSSDVFVDLPYTYSEREAGELVRTITGGNTNCYVRQLTSNQNENMVHSLTNDNTYIDDGCYIKEKHSNVNKEEYSLYPQVYRKQFIFGKPDTSYVKHFSTESCLDFIAKNPRINISAENNQYIAFTAANSATQAIDVSYRPYNKQIIYYFNGNQALLITDTELRPIPTNTLTLGDANFLWKEIFCANATINTSDERQKQDIAPVDEAVFRAWSKVNFIQYKFKDAVAKKGEENARIHFGVIAQRVKEAFESEGLDAFKYGLLCYDEWEAEPEEKDEDGNIVNPGHEAGNAYGIRYSEALALECAYQRYELDKIKAQLSNK